MLSIAWIRTVALTACVLFGMTALAAPPRVPSPVAARSVARPMGPLKRAYLREVASWRSIFKKPARFTRFALTSAASIGAAAITGYFTGSPSAAAFASFTAGVAADRLADRLLPGSRPLGVRAPPPLLRDALQTLVGGSVAAVATPMALRLLAPLSSRAAGIPGIFGFATQLVLARPVVHSAGTFLANRLAATTRWALQAMSLRNERRDTAPN